MSTNKEQYFAQVMNLIVQKNGDVAADAIRGCIDTLLDHNLCSMEEFLCLIDLDFRPYWDYIADDIASSAEQEIREGHLHPNKLKPWQCCRNYKELFRTTSYRKEWRELHSALDSIVGHISARFSC